VKPLLVSLAVFSALSAAPRTATFVGVISDDMCWKAGHDRMRMGPTDAECTTACVKEHDAAYVLVAGPNVYTLSDQKRPEQFAARKVRITGILDDKTKVIAVKSIVADR
jgi:hypothetical protein